MVRRKAKADSSPSLLPGYTHLSEIGGGAFATVYRAMEVETGREVALKVLKVDTVHPHLVETFEREIHALAKVSDHPNIVTLYRPLQTPDGRPVLVLELCHHSLSGQIRSQGPLGPEEATRVGIKIAGALETAHRSGFLHRDMKPQNILVTGFGEPALADFGVAALQASAQATVGVFGFTTLHAAPEMLEGHHLSPATDVYGLASTMYQLLAGRAPFAAFDNEAPASVILRILRDPVRPLYSEGIPLALSDLLEASLSKEPEGRPRSALDFAVLLQAVEAAEGWGPTAYVAWGEAGWSETHDEAPARPALPPLIPGRDQPPHLPSPRPAVRPSVTPPAPSERQVVDPPEGQRGQLVERRAPDGEPLAPLAPLDRLPGGPWLPSARPVFLDPLPEERPVGVERTPERAQSPPRPALSETDPPPRWSLRDVPPVVTMLLGFAAALVVVAVLLVVGAI